jgi:hypothetical protein
MSNPFLMAMSLKTMPTTSCARLKLRKRRLPGPESKGIARSSPGVGTLTIRKTQTTGALRSKRRLTLKPELPALQLIGSGAAMFDGFSKREILAIVGGLLVVAVLGIWGGVYLAKSLIGDRSNDPLERAGGLSPQQTIQAK